MEPRKNVVGLLKAFELLNEMGEKGTQLVLVGHEGWGLGEVKEAWESSPARSSIRYIGYVPDEVLGLLYRNAEIFVFLSLYEGLKSSRGAHFYYFQHEFVGLFRHPRQADGQLEVILCQFGEGMRTALDREGIRYMASGPIDIEELQQEEEASEEVPTQEEAVDESSGIESGLNAAP